MQQTSDSLTAGCTGAGAALLPAARRDLWGVPSRSEETMANFSLWATFGLCLLKLCLAETRKFFFIIIIIIMNENTYDHR